MSLLSGIGDALKGIVKVAAPVVGTIFGGPIGGAIGSAVSGAASLLGKVGSTVGSVLANNVGPILGGAAQVYSAKDVAEQNKEVLEQQNEYNVTNAATANAFTERMQGLAMDFNSAEAEKARGFDREMASQAIGENRFAQQRQMDFEREMSGTAYQRARADLAAAGFNPILAVNQGGASTPSVSAQSAPSPSSGSASVGGGGGAMSGASVLPGVNKIGPALATAIQLKTVAQELDNMQAQRRLIDANAFKTDSEAHLAYEQGRVAKRQADDAEKYGTGSLGVNLGGLGRTTSTMFEALRDFFGKLTGAR